MTDRVCSRRTAVVTLLVPVLVLTSLSAGCQEADKSKSPSPVIATVGTGNGPITLTATDEAVWVEPHRENRLARIDPLSNKLDRALLGVPVRCEIAAAKGSVWATIFAENMVTRFDAGTGKILQQVPIEDPFVVVPAEDCLWITSEDEGGVLRRVDRATHEVTTVGKFPLVDSAVLAFGYLWLSARDGGGVWKLDPSTDEVLDQTKLSGPLAWSNTVTGSGSPCRTVS